MTGTALRPRSARERGFALLIVLWALVLLALIFSRLVAAGRGESEIAFNLRAAAQMQAQADGLLYRGIFNLLGPTAGRWRPDGAVHHVTLPDGAGVIIITDLSGRVNPNTASAALLSALLHQVGAQAATSAAVGQAIADWRSPDAQGQFAPAQYHDAGFPYLPPGAPFNSLNELNLVMGMTPALLSRLAPHLSIFNRDNVNPAAADAMVRAAMKEVGIAVDGSSEPRQPRDVLIRATIASADGARAVREADVELETSKSPLHFQILTWSN